MASRHLVVGVDASEGSAAAVAWCAGVAGDLDADVVAVHAVDLAPYATPPTSFALPVLSPEWREALRYEMTDVWCAPLQRTGVAHRVLLVDGPAAPTLIDVADDLHADLVVVGRRGHGGFAELLLGSVPHHLSHHCPRPVVIVPAGA